MCVANLFIIKCSILFIYINDLLSLNNATDNYYVLSSLRIVEWILSSKQD